MQFWFFLVAGAALAVFAALLMLVWANRGAENFFEIATRVAVLPMLAAVAVVLFEFSKPAPPFRQQVDLLLMHNEQGRMLSPLLAAGPERFHGWLTLLSISNHLPLRVASTRITDEDVRESDLDVAETTLLAWLMARYDRHWDLNRRVFRGVRSWQVEYPPSDGAEKAPRLYFWSDLSLLAKDNPILQKHVADRQRLYAFQAQHGVNLLLQQERVAVPSDTTVVFRRDARIREIVLNSREATIRIRLSSGLAEYLDTEAERIFGDIKGAMFGLPFLTHAVRVEFSADYLRFLRYSPRTMRKARWIADAATAFHDEFDWAHTKNALKEAGAKLQ